MRGQKSPGLRGPQDDRRTAGRADLPFLYVHGVGSRVANDRKQLKVPKEPFSARC
jgi:hypothetical protein